MVNELHDDPILKNVPEVDGYKVLNPCVLYGKLGQGGMGTVYRGKHINLDIDVAVKCLRPSLAASDRDLVTRFEREAKVAASISNQNLIRVYDVDAQHGVHYLVMEYVEGETASERVTRKGPLGETEAARILLGAAHGLAAAHRSGVVHRDVKPDNILVSLKGEVKLADLGLAKAIEGNGDGVTMTQVMMGTPNYMPPEQWEDVKTVGPPGDLYALGATAAFLLTGENPISGKSFTEVMRKACTEPFPDIREKRPDLAPGFVEILQKCTEKKAEDRYQNAGELVYALESWGGIGPGSLVDPEAGVGAKGEPLLSPPPGQTLATIKIALEKGTHGLTEHGEAAARLQKKISDSSVILKNRGGQPTTPVAAPAPGMSDSTVAPTLPPGSRRLEFIMGAVVILLVLVVILLMAQTAFFPRDKNGDSGSDDRAKREASGSPDPGTSRDTSEPDKQPRTGAPEDDGSSSPGSPPNPSSGANGSGEASGDQAGDNDTTEKTPAGDPPPRTPDQVDPANVANGSDPSDTAPSEPDDKGSSAGSGTSDTNGGQTQESDRPEVVNKEPSRGRRSLQEGLMKLEEGHFKYAIRLFRSAIQEEPELKIEAEFHIGDAYLKQAQRLQDDLQDTRGAYASVLESLKAYDGIEAKTLEVSLRKILETKLNDTLAIESPAKGEVVTDTPVVVTVVVPEGISVVLVNEVPAEESNGKFIARLEATDGPLELTVTAKDDLGIEGMKRHSIRVDSGAPVLALVEPSGALVPTGTITLSGTVTDLTACTVTVDGEDVPVTDGAWTTEIKGVQEGSRSIKIVATDSGGQASTKMLNVTAYPRPPAKISYVGKNTQGYHEYSLDVDPTIVFVRIPTATFVFGRDPQATPTSEHVLSSYLISKYEITNAQYARFWLEHRKMPSYQLPVPSEALMKSVLTEQQFAQWSTQLNRDEKGQFLLKYFQEWAADHPVVGLTWVDAVDFCEPWDLRLPYEAEWEYAACGPEEFLFPWGNEFDSNRLNYSGFETVREFAVSDAERFARDGFLFTAPVQSFPSGQSHFGVFQMAGNVREWCQTVRGPYSAAKKSDDVGPSQREDSEMIVRGGSFRSVADYSNTVYRDWEKLKRRKGDSQLEWNGLRPVRKFEE